jgi:hypothetical protein
MSLSKARLAMIALASAGCLMSTSCVTSDGYYDGSNVHGSVSVGYYGGYYDDAWCCYGGYPPPIYYPPGGNGPGNGNRPEPPIGNGPNRPSTLPAQVTRPGGAGNYSRPAPSSRPMPSSRPASRPAPSPRPVSRPMGGGGRRR